jgi:hypothetical protein
VTKWHDDVILTWDASPPTRERRAGLPGLSKHSLTVRLLKNYSLCTKGLITLIASRQTLGMSFGVTQGVARVIRRHIRTADDLVLHTNTVHGAR